jgi:hypothetical protein
MEDLVMTPMSVAEYVRERGRKDTEPRQLGPFVTISRQYGCYGYSLAARLVELLNATAAPGQGWTVYGKEGLSELAEQTHLPLDVLEQQRRREPRFIEEVFRYLSHEETPSCWELRRRIPTVIRGLAADGHAIVVGHGGACATQDLPNGLSIRLEAPQAWRIRQTALGQGIDEAEAARRIRAVEHEREYLRMVYSIRFPRRPGFTLVYDCSVFTLEELARHIVCLMRMKQFA